MLLEVGVFCAYVENDLNGLIDYLKDLTHFQSAAQTEAWRKSLPQLSKALSHPSLSHFHIQVGPSGHMAVEYNLPASSSWCDAVLLGRGQANPAVVMLELKDWDIRGDQPAGRETLIGRHGVTYSHPSDKVRGYVEYCQHFHSAVVEQKASVAGCVFLTSARDAGVYRGAPYTNLVAQYPVFTSSEIPGMATYLAGYLRQPDPDFATAFEHGHYTQDRNLIRQLSDLILRDDQQVFVLLDEQRKGYEYCLLQIDELLASAQPDQKLAIVIEGPPGSGKSVLAAKLWAALADDYRRQGLIVMTSTSSAQKSNWQVSFEQAAHRMAGRGVVLPANKYNPGLNTNWINGQRAAGRNPSAATWEKNLEVFAAEGRQNAMPNNHIWVSIVDEAHALVDPSLEGLSGVAASGWAVMAGPQAYHVLRASQVSIFLMDSDQSYRDNETTTPARIQELAVQKLGVPGEAIKTISLGDAQFRCGGSKEYINWLEQFLHLQDGAPDDLSWRRLADGTGRFEFELAADPADMEEHLRQYWRNGHSVRLMASYARKWVTKDIYQPHNLPLDKMDFHIPYRRDGKLRYWSRVWNYAPRADYSKFIQAPPGTRMHDDPLCEVGCPYVVRGFDYDYLGILWLKDLVWRNDHWEADPSQVFETA